VFERLRSALRAALDAATLPPDWHELRAELHAAAVEGRVAIGKMRDGLAAVERDLTVERRHLEDAERRGRLAAEIDDHETVEVAERFVVRHRERLAVLEQKRDAQHAELALAEREVGEMVAQLKDVDARGGVTPPPRPAATEDAAAGLGAELDRRAREADAEARLRDLKKRMGR